GLEPLRRWIVRGPPAAARLETLLDRIAAPRAGVTAPPRLMGVVNVTPDSFSDGGLHLDPRTALAHCRALAEDGADILDIGGESTRPGAAAVAPDAEIARVQPVLAGLGELRAGFPELRLSIDTRHAKVMRAALDAGIDIINDVTALTGDAGSVEVAAAGAADIVLMHMQGTPETMNLAPAYDDVALDVFDFLEARIEACRVAGIARDRLIVDPGIGFAKRGQENQEILRALTLFHGLGCPVLLGLSRKGLGIAKRTLTPGEREPASLAAAYYALSQGVQILRVHDVAATRQAVELWRRLNANDA
ncbi:MAG: dihydropteroate synthase, partial [Rhodanobacter sp.]